VLALGRISSPTSGLGYPTGAFAWRRSLLMIKRRRRPSHTCPTPTPDHGIYGVVADKNGVMWGAGWQKGTISKWSPESSLVTEYPVPTSSGQMRITGIHAHYPDGDKPQ
jgi:hypothetical protein